jgi:hypothetical protein
MPIFNHTAHKEMWQWLSEHPTKEKGEWPGWDRNGGTTAFALLNCFACEYSEDGKDTGCTCINCPLVWPNDFLNYACEKEGSPYLNWTDTEDPEERRQLAEEVRDLPVKDGVKTI